MEVVASQDLGPLGPSRGTPVEADCPPGDSLRSVAGALAVLLLLLIRKPNRTKQAWTLPPALIVLWLLLGFAERRLNVYLVFHYHQYLCTSFADLLRYLSLGIGLVLCISDRLVLPWRWLRFLVVLLLLGLFGQVQIALNAWPMLHSAGWAIIYSLMLLVFMLGHAVVVALLKRWVRPERYRRVHAGFCLLVGVLPGLILVGVDWMLSSSVQLQSTTELLRVIDVLTSGITLPYFVFFWFILLARYSPLYAERLVRGFGLPAPAAARDAVSSSVGMPETAASSHGGI